MNANDDFKGLTRFHKVTIGFGVAFCVVMVVHYARGYWMTGEGRFLVMGGVALVGGGALAFYLKKFSQKGI